jgi:hypothetical protein
MIKYIINWFKLIRVEWTINKYRIYGSEKVKLKYKPMLKRALIHVLRVKVNNITCGMLVASQKAGQPRVTYVDLIWANEKNFQRMTAQTESTYYQAVYDVFMQWYDDVVVRPIRNRRLRTDDVPAEFKHQVAICLNITKERQVEKFRRILTLYGFNTDPELMLRDVEFFMPYREKEKITTVIYTKSI